MSVPTCNIDVYNNLFRDHYFKDHLLVLLDLEIHSTENNKYIVAGTFWKLIIFEANRVHIYNIYNII